MSNQHITLFVELSDEDKLLEQELEKQRHETSIKINIAIKQQNPYKELMDLESELYCSIRDLKGGVYADKGLRMPKNSTELAEALLIKANKVAHIEEEYINGRLDLYRNEMQLISVRIESIITYSLQNGLDKKFNDFAFIIKYWIHEKRYIFKEPEDCRPQVSYRHIPMIEKNIIGYYIQKLMYIKSLIGELNYKKTKETQASSLISICEIVKSSMDDNRIFDQLFLMGQRSANLNNIESNINDLIAKDRSQRYSSSKSDWAHELAQSLYLEHWIHNDYPSTFTVVAELDSGKYRHLKADNIKLDKYGEKLPKVHEKTMERVIREQRLLYSEIDPRITLPQKGRPKKK